MGLEMTRAMKGRVAVLGAVAVIALFACSNKDRGDAGPLDVGLTVESGQVVKPGTTIGWGLVLLTSPDERRFTVLSARALTDVEGTSVQPAFGLGWPRGIGGIQFTSWPPSDPEFGATPTPLPVDIAPNNGGTPPSTEIFVGITVPPGGVLMDGVELEYTDGESTWRTVMRHRVRFCTSGAVEACTP